MENNDILENETTDEVVEKVEETVEEAAAEETVVDTIAEDVVEETEADAVEEADTEETVEEFTVETEGETIVFDNLANAKSEANSRTAKKLIILVVVLALAIFGISFGILNDAKSKEASNVGSQGVVSGVVSTETGSETALTENVTFDLNVNNVMDYVKTLGEYKNIDVVATKSEASDDLAKYYAEYFFMEEISVVDGRVAKEGDTVVISYVGTIDGVAFDGGTADNQTLKLGSHSYIDGFEDGLVGAVAGEVRELNLKFPDNYTNADLSGKDCVFTVTVNGVIPGFDDEGVALLGYDDITNVEEYIADVKDYLNDYYNDQYMSTVIYSVLESAIANTEFGEIPADLIAEERKEVSDTYSDAAASYGYDLESYLVANGTSLDEVAESYAKQKLVLYAICAKENLYPTDEEAYAYYSEQIEGSAYETVEEYYEAVTKEAAILNVMISKVSDLLFANANVSEE